MKQVSLFAKPHDGVDLCVSCGKLSKCHLIKLNETQMRMLEGLLDQDGRYGNLTKWTEARPVCKGCVRKLRRGQMGPTELQHGWEIVSEPAQ